MQREVSSASRLPTPAGSGFQPEADLVWELGRQGELFALSVSEGLRDGSVEVKNDARFRDRVFIEYACQWSDGEWHDSGIFETGANIWFIVLRERFGIACPVPVLKAIVERMVASGHKARGTPPDDWGLVEKPSGGGDQWPTRGVVIPQRHLVRWLLNA